MKKIIIYGKHICAIIILSLLFLGNLVSAQTDLSQGYYNQLYHTAKVWGYYKYFHPKLANGKINWDQKLLEMIDDLEGGKKDDDFIHILYDMMGEAGVVPGGDVCNILPPYSEQNLNLNWFNNPYFSIKVRSIFKDIKRKYCSQFDHFYVKRTLSYTRSPCFDNDNRFNDWVGGDYPPEEYRLLALFRFWNIMNYFYPYGNNRTDDSWDRTLRDFIPKFVNVKSKTAYYTVFQELIKSLNDNGIRIEGELEDQIYGTHYLPLELKQIGNNTVISKVLIKTGEIRVGDVIKSINNIDINTFRNNLFSTTGGGNVSVINRNINRRIIRGLPETVKMVVQYQIGERERKVTLVRNLKEAEYHNMIQNSGPVWEVQNYEISKSYGYVDMERLRNSDITTMFQDLKATNAIILDVRNIPRTKIDLMIAKLFSGPQRNVDVIFADATYPGFLQKKTIISGYGNFSMTYKNKVFILVDEETEGLGELAAMTYAMHPKAMIIGTRTAGDVNYVREEEHPKGNNTLINLPGDMQIRYTPHAIVYPDSTQTHRIGIIPDYSVRPSLADIRMGRDVAMMKAISMISIKDVDQVAYVTAQPRLHRNYPNPFNPITYISYELNSENSVKISVYNTSGQQVWQSATLNQKAGVYKTMFNGAGMNSGIYFYRLNIAGKDVDSRKMMLIK